METRRYGKEFVVQQFGNGVIFRKSQGILSFQYIGVFTTMTNCSLDPNFVWKENPVPERIPLGSTLSIEIFATVNDGDCPVAHYL